MDHDRIDQIIAKHHAEPSSLIQVMLEIQSENHWLPQEALERVSERLQVPLARIQHIATFYKAFSLVPKGRHEIHVCMGTACYVKQSGRILEKLEQHLRSRGIEWVEDESNVDVSFRRNLLRREVVVTVIVLLTRFWETFVSGTQEPPS